MCIYIYIYICIMAGPLLLLLLLAAEHLLLLPHLRNGAGRVTAGRLQAPGLPPSVPPPALLEQGGFPSESGTSIWNKGFPKGSKGFPFGVRDFPLE